MKTIRLDTIILFALLVPFIMTYRISPGMTPYWLFGLIFLGLLSYICVDIFKLKDRKKFLVKTILLIFLITSSIGAASYSEIVVRHQTSPIYNVHDIILQQEAAVRFLLHGKNPYEATYFGTPLEQWHYSDTAVNPALYHFVMQPLYLISAVPFYIVSTRTLGFFDGRTPLMFFFFSLLAMAFYLVKDKEKRLIFVSILAFNPATLGYLIEGRDDVYMFVFLFASLMLFNKKRFSLGGIAMALAFAVKQSVWPIFPFYIAFLYFKNNSFKKTLIQIIPFALTFSLIVLPFVFWNIMAFLNSTVFFLSGNALHSYPISGYGFGMILNDIGIIKDVNSYFPFWMIQALIAGPLMVILILWQKRNNTIFRLILSYAVFLFVFWYFSRYFNNSHLGYISMVLVTAYFWPQQEIKEV